MISVFIRGLLTVLIVMVITIVAVLLLSWIKERIKARLDEKETHKVIFADTEEIIDDEMKQKIADSDEISMEDLEALCDKAPFVMATYDSETGKIFDYAGIKPDSVQPAVTDILHNNGGWVVVEE